MREAIEHLYQAFALHPLKQHIIACPCGCIAPDEQLVLAQVGLRELPCEQLSRYAFKAITTWGDEDDYRHFLPRILDLAATDEGPGWPGLDLGVISGKILAAGWSTWPTSEGAAVAGYFSALWRRTLERPPEATPHRADDILCGAAHLLDVSSYCAAWERAPSLNATLHLAAFVEQRWEDLAKTGHLQGEWRNTRGDETVAGWLRSPACRQALEVGFERALDRPEASRLATAVDLLQWITGAA